MSQHDDSVRLRHMLDAARQAQERPRGKSTRGCDPEDRGVAVQPGLRLVPDLPRDFLRSNRVPCG